MRIYYYSSINEIIVIVWVEAGNCDLEHSNRFNNDCDVREFFVLLPREYKTVIVALCDMNEIMSYTNIICKGHRYGCCLVKLYSNVR